MSFPFKECPSGRSFVRLAVPFFAGLLLVNAARAQQTLPNAPIPDAPAPTAPAIAIPAVAIAPIPLPAIADGTPIKLKLKDDLDIGDTKKRSAVPFVVAEDVLDASGKVVVPAGTPAIGRVLMPSMQKGGGVKSIFKSGKIEKPKLTCDYVALTDSAHIPLRLSQKLDDHPGSEVTSAMNLGSLSSLFLGKGNHVVKAEKQSFTMYVNLPPAVVSPTAAPVVTVPPAAPPGTPVQ